MIGTDPARNIRLEPKSKPFSEHLDAAAYGENQSLETYPDDGQQGYSSPAVLSWSSKRSK